MVKTPGKISKNMSSSDKFILTPTRENEKNIFISANGRHRKEGSSGNFSSKQAPSNPSMLAAITQSHQFSAAYVASS